MEMEICVVFSLYKDVHSQNRHYLRHFGDCLENSVTSWILSSMCVFDDTVRMYVPVRGAFCVSLRRPEGGWPSFSRSALRRISPDLTP